MSWCGLGARGIAIVMIWMARAHYPLFCITDVLILITWIQGEKRHVFLFITLFDHFDVSHVRCLWTCTYRARYDTSVYAQSLNETILDGDCLWVMS